MAEANHQTTKLISLERETRGVNHENQWQGDAERAKEMTELYRQLGFEVFVEPVQLSESIEDCQACRPLMQREYKTIYTRKRVNDDNANGNT
jgi:hypothetical protein